MESERSTEKSRDRSFDVVVFGASGVTGKYLIEELWSHHPSLKWAVAGRSHGKVKAAVEEVRSLLENPPDSVEIPVIEADVNDVSSLIAMCKQTAVIINCVGPFRFYGESVVSAAIECGTHYLDVSGEPQFLESMQVKYFDAAKEKNVYVVGCCGFDSIPCDIGIEFVKNNFEGDLCSVETYLKFKRAPGATANFATWQSAIYGFAHASELISIRQQLSQNLFKKKYPKSTFRPKKPFLFKDEEVGGWCVPFVGSDKSVCYRTQMHNFNIYNERPVNVDTYFCVGSLFSTLGLLLLGLIFGLLAKFTYGRHLLEEYPELFSYGMFSKSPPKREKGQKSMYWMIFKGCGWPEKASEATDQHSDPPTKNIQCTLTGNDNGYETTAICSVSCAEIILNETKNLPDFGGVFTPGVAFQKTHLLERLHNRGLIYKIDK